MYTTYVWHILLTFYLPLYIPCPPPLPPDVCNSLVVLGIFGTPKIACGLITAGTHYQCKCGIITMFTLEWMTQ